MARGRHRRPRGGWFTTALNSVALVARMLVPDPAWLTPCPNPECIFEEGHPGHCVGRWGP